MVLKNNSSGLIEILYTGYLNDFCAGIFIVAFANLLLQQYDMAINTFGKTIGFVFSCGLMWEYFAPLVKQEAVADWMDIIVYILGGVFYCHYKKILQEMEK